MKRLTVLASFLSLLLAACATAVPAATATPHSGAQDVPADATFVPAGQSQATPDVGWVGVVSATGIKAVLLRSQPDHKSALAGRVFPGETGELLGHDQTGTWVLVSINHQTGWIPIQLVNITVEQ